MRQCALAYVTVLLIAFSVIYVNYFLIQDYKIFYLKIDTQYVSLFSINYIKIIGPAWKTTNLRVLIVKPSWLNKSYVDSVTKAFIVWDRSLESFGKSYRYSYLSRFSFQITVREYKSSGYDIVVIFSRKYIKGGGEIGATKIKYIKDQILSAEITLYIYTSMGTLSPTDIFNIALHEIGHALGLGHSSSKETINGLEVMYPYYELGVSEMRPSTLDAYALAKLYAWLRTGEFITPGKITVTLPPNIAYRMLLYYYVQIYSQYGKVYGAGWYLEGANVTIYVNSSKIELGKGIRVVFKGWKGDISSNKLRVSFIILRDMNITAVWKKQYYINISTSFSKTNISPGWYDGDLFLNISLEKYIVYENNLTRHIFVEWNGDIFSNKSFLYLRVEKPLDIVVVWRKQYKVTINTTYSKPLQESGWYNEGSVIKIGVIKDNIHFNNNTRIVLYSWNGSVYVNKSSFNLKVLGPLFLNAVWIREYYVSIKSLYVETNIKSGWYPEGKNLEIFIKNKIVEHDNGTRHVFLSWNIGNKTFFSSHLNISISSPLLIKSLWATEYRVYLAVKDSSNKGLRSKVYLTGCGNRSIIANLSIDGRNVWLRKGIWKINKLLWYRSINHSSFFGLYSSKNMEGGRFEEYKLKNYINVSRPLNYIIHLPVYEIQLTLIDIIGVPAPLYYIVINGDECYSGINGIVFTTKMLKGDYVLKIFFLGIEILKSTIYIDKNGIVQVRVPISIYTIIILLFSILLFYKVFISVRRAT